MHGPAAEQDDVDAACAAYELAIRDAGGVDLQLLGIGSEGHLAFNEPGSSLSSRTRIKTLTGRTRADNARFFDDPRDVPRHVLTQGLGTILEARHLLLLATGERKADAVAAMVEGPLGSPVPGVGAAAAPLRHRPARPGRRVRSRAGRVLPRGRRRQALLAALRTTRPPLLVSLRRRGAARSTGCQGRGRWLS